MAEGVKDRGAPSGGEAGFNTGALIAVVLIAAALFTAALYASLGEQTGRDRGDLRAPSANGQSAVGVGGLADLMRGLAWEVETRAGEPGFSPAGAVVLVTDVLNSRRLEEAADRHRDAEAVLIMLPKWRIRELQFGRRFASRVRRVPLFSVRGAVNGALEAGGAASIGPSPAVRQGESAKARRVAIGDLPSAPTLADPQTLAQDDRLRPLATLEDGSTLVAEIIADDPFGPPMFLLSDPDPLLNHGLDDGANAAFAVRLFEYLADGRTTLLAIDHGPAPRTTPASFWFAMFEPPLAAVTLAILALFLVLGLISVARFGTRATDRPGQAAGKDALLDAAAALLRQGDGDRFVIRRFFEETVRDLGARLQAPAGADHAALLRWLRQMERTRLSGAAGERRDGASLEAEVEALVASGRPNAELMTALAQEINRWREEMLRGQR
ncbi:MAG: hypothetical protein AAF909_02420 [Pseudomonadota bacterium]